MLRCIEQELCNISYMHPNDMIKFNEFYRKIEPPMSIAADFDCMIVPVESINKHIIDKLFVNKPFELGYIIVKVSYTLTEIQKKKATTIILMKIALNGV